MILVCHDWFYNLEIPAEGVTLESLWEDRNCSLIEEGSIRIDSEGNQNDSFSGTGSYYCTEHDNDSVSFHTDYLEHANALLQNDYFTCFDADHDLPDRLVFPTFDDLNLHIVDDHQQDEDENEDENEVVPPNDIITHDLPLRPHPPIPEDLRIAALAQIQNSYGGILIDPTPPDSPHHMGHLTTHESQPTLRQLDSWRHSWPRLFWVAANDPHLRNPTARTIHADWAH